MSKILPEIWFLSESLIRWLQGTWPEGFQEKIASQNVFKGGVDPSNFLTFSETKEIVKFVKKWLQISPFS